MTDVTLVYEALGRLLNNPQAFGLGDQAPKPLVEALSAMRQSLQEQSLEEQQLASEDWLSSELSQDADRRHPSVASGLSQRRRY